MGSLSNWVIIANPVAGRGKARRKACQLARLLDKEGVANRVLWTTRQKEAESMASEVATLGVRGVLACGGDGTIHEVINGLLSNPKGQEISVGVIPAGRCNDFQSSVRLPSKPEEIAEWIIGGKVRSIDLGRTDGRYYITVATLGFDSAVSQYVADGRAPRFLSGTPAYLYAIMVQLKQYKDTFVRLKSDSFEFEGDIFLAATANIPQYGGSMMIAPSAVVDDGALDLCLVRSVSRWEVLKMLPRIFKGGHVYHPAVSLHRVKRIEIETRRPLWVWADGEPLTQTKAVIEVAPNALSIVAPP